VVGSPPKYGELEKLEHLEKNQEGEEKRLQTPKNSSESIGWERSAARFRAGKENRAT